MFTTGAQGYPQHKRKFNRRSVPLVLSLRKQALQAVATRRLP